MDPLQRSRVTREGERDGDVRVAGGDDGKGGDRRDVERRDPDRLTRAYLNVTIAEDHREDHQEHQREDQSEEERRGIAEERLVDVPDLAQGKAQIVHACVPAAPACSVIWR